MRRRSGASNEPTKVPARQTTKGTREAEAQVGEESEVARLRRDLNGALKWRYG